MQLAFKIVVLIQGKWCILGSSININYTLTRQLLRELPVQGILYCKTATEFVTRANGQRNSVNYPMTTGCLIRLSDNGDNLVKQQIVILLPNVDGIPFCLCEIQEQTFSLVTTERVVK